MEKFVVGGAVRDYHMGLRPKDVDYVVVGSTPEEMLAAGFEQVGADFPVFLDKDGNEYALARTERKTGRGYMGFETNHDTSVTLEDDLMRRDLTINAMAHKVDGCDADGNCSMTLVDPFGGLEDLQNKVLRHVSPAFADDPVRVLRLARFHARFGPEWVVSESTKEFCRDMATSGELEHLTRERVLKELEKALSEPYPSLFFQTLREVWALDVVLPEFKDFEKNIFLGEEDASDKMRYASCTVYMEDAEALEQRLNVSVEWRRYSRMWRSMLNNSRYMHPVDTLYAMDAYRQSELWEEMQADFAAIDYGFSLPQVYEKTKDVSFASLSAEQQATLKGPEIAKALHKIRKDMVLIL